MMKLGSEWAAMVNWLPAWYGGPGDTVTDGVPGAKLLSSMVTNLCSSWRFTWLNSFTW